MSLSQSVVMRFSRRRSDYLRVTPPLFCQVRCSLPTHPILVFRLGFTVCTAPMSRPRHFRGSCAFTASVSSFKLVEIRGLEPLASCVQGRRSSI